MCIIKLKCKNGLNKILNCIFIKEMLKSYLKIKKNVIETCYI